MKRTTFVATLLVLLVVPGALAAVKTQSAIPERPEQLQYGQLEFEVPEAEPYRHELPNGIVAYVAEDHDLPLVDISLRLKIGSFLDPPDKSGLAALTGTMIRRGGAGEMSAEEFDEQADFLAAQFGTWTGDVGGGAQLDCITPVLDECLDMFFTMLKQPNFEQERLEVEKSNILENIKQRNDDAGDILGREWSWLIYGEDHFASRLITQDALDAITRDDLVAFHRKYWRPENMIVAVAGDVDTEAVLAKLAERFESWPGEGEDVTWPPPPPAHEPIPGVYHVEKDIPQGKVYIGQLSSKWTDWNDPDKYALMVMNHILGGSGFTSRITKKVRSDEGLAYSAYSSYQIGQYWPGTFRIGFQSKSATVALAAKLALDEVRDMRNELVTDKELQTAKNAIIESFPRQFESPASTVGAFVQDEYLDRPHSYWQKYRDHIRAVSAEDVRRVAKQYLDPDDMVFLVVGQWADIAVGDPDGRASMEDFFSGQRKVTHLPLRDPLTLEPMADEQP
jgi:predicted Zn-dependent peptidase